MTSGVQQAAFVTEAVRLPALIDITAVAGTQSLRFFRNGTLDVLRNGAVVVPLAGWNMNKLSTIGDQFQARLDNPFFYPWTGNVTDAWITVGADLAWHNSGTPQLCQGVLRVRRLGSTVTLFSCDVSIRNV